MDYGDADIYEHEEHDIGIWYGNNINVPEQRIDNNIVNSAVNHSSTYIWNKNNGCVTTLYRCDANDAKGLCIFDGAYKLLKSDQYDIGGAYIEHTSGFWFYFTTSSGPGHNYLMNIFVCQRNPGMFSLGISNSNTLSTTTTCNKEKFRTLSNELYWQNFSSTHPDEVKYIKTFRFSEKDRLSLLKMVLIMPMSINVNPNSILIKDIVQKIKAEVDFGEKLLKDEETDFVLMSGEGKKFQVHKIVLSAHSPKLRDMIRQEDCKTLSLDITNYETELLLNYLYTGIIRDISKQHLKVLLVMADKFELKRLTELVKHTMKLSINSENAIEVSVISEKYNYEDVQEAAFNYISQHPEVLDSDAFSELDNANVVKKLLKYIHT